MSPFLSSVKRLALDAFFPPICALCKNALNHHEASALLCDLCRASIPLFDTPHCTECGARLPDGVVFCHPSSFPLYAASAYGNPHIQSLIWALKYGKHPAYAKPLAGLAAKMLAPFRNELESFVLVPIPLYRNRLRLRGFNQAEEIASQLGEMLSLPVRADILFRTKKTLPQAETEDWTKRAKNLENAFRAVPAKDLNVALIDDVATSGATLTAAREALKKAGAKKIISITAASARSAIVSD